MFLLDFDALSLISGGYYVHYDEEHHHSFSTTNGSAFTMQWDGSLPPEFQARIDSGESFKSMQDDMRDYLMITRTLQFFHPELFTAFI